MGGGGQTTTLGVYLERRGTHTGVAPVSVSQQCWASRASEALIENGQVTYITPHVEKKEVPALRAELQQELAKSESKGIVHELTTPVSAEDLLKLRVGDVVYLNGIICTARDRAHRRMVEHIKQGKRQEIPEEKSLEWRHLSFRTGSGKEIELLVHHGIRTDHQFQVYR